MATNPFVVLEVSPHCSADDIKKSFRHLALEHHPDKGGSKERFQDIYSAYEILRDHANRAAYAQAVLGARRRSQNSTSADVGRSSNSTSADNWSGPTREERRAKKAHGAATENPHDARDCRRSTAERDARERRKRRDEEEAFQKELDQKRRQQRKNEKKQIGETNAERVQRLQVEREAWKAECRRRRREGEEAARLRAQLNAELRKGELSSCS